MSDEKHKAIIDRVATALNTSIKQTLRPLLAEQHSDDERLHALRGAHQVVAHHVGLPHDLMISEREEGIQNGEAHGAHHVAGFCVRCAN